MTPNKSRSKIFLLNITDDAALMAFASDNDCSRELVRSDLITITADQDLDAVKQQLQELCFNESHDVILYWQRPWINKILTCRVVYENRSSLPMPTTITVDSNNQEFVTSHTITRNNEGEVVATPLPEIVGTLTMDESRNKVEVPSTWIGCDGIQRGMHNVVMTEYATSYNLLTTDEKPQRRRPKVKGRPKHPNK